MIDSVKKPECAVASVLTTLMRTYKDFIDESKHAELKGTSALKLCREHLLENEKRTSDCSQLHSMVLLFDFSTEKIMDDKTKVLIGNACHFVQK